MLVGQLRQLGAALGHQRLVGGHDRDAAAQRRLDVGAGRLDAAGDLDQDVEVASRRASATSVGQERRGRRPARALAASRTATPTSSSGAVAASTSASWRDGSLSSATRAAPT